MWSQETLRVEEEDRGRERKKHDNGSRDMLLLPLKTEEGAMSQGMTGASSS